MSTPADVRLNPNLADRAAAALLAIAAERQALLDRAGVATPIYPTRIARALLAYQHAAEMHEIEGCRYARHADQALRGGHLAAVLEEEWATMVGAIADEIGQAETARWLATELPEPEPDPEPEREPSRPGWLARVGRTLRGLAR